MEENAISIIYANRNRDLERIEISLNSLAVQTDKYFEVVLVDYGSEVYLANDLEALTSKFQFVKLFLLDVSQLLWNKSKALNFGIKKAETPYIFIADVDLVFHPDSVSLMRTLAVSDKFWLFKLGYLGKMESAKLQENYVFKDLRPNRQGLINGMVLTSRESLIAVNGYDEFFHFYGAEDVDLFNRLELSGLIVERNDAEYFYHNWHKSFSGSEDKLLTGNPRIKNIMRINQQHFRRNRERKILKPLRQIGMGEIPVLSLKENLKIPTLNLKVPNVLARVEHFIHEELPSYRKEIVNVEFYEDPYYRSLKYKLKKIAGKSSQPYLSMKEVNDMVLKKILFNYRDHNYSFEVGKDRKTIKLCIQL